MKNYYIAILMVVYIMLVFAKIREKRNQEINFVVTPMKNDIYYKKWNSLLLKIMREWGSHSQIKYYFVKLTLYPKIWWAKSGTNSKSKSSE